MPPGPSYQWPRCSRDRELRTQERFRRRRAEREDDARPDDLDLLVEVGTAVRHLFRVRRAVAQPRPVVERRAALDRVGDVDVLARQADREQHAIEQFAGASDERPAQSVFRLARPFADDHQPRAADRPRRRRCCVRVEPIAHARHRSTIAAAADRRCSRAAALLQAHEGGGPGSSTTASPTALTRDRSRRSTRPPRSAAPTTPFAPSDSARSRSAVKHSSRTHSASLRSVERRETDERADRPPKGRAHRLAGRTTSPRRAPEPAHDAKAVEAVERHDRFRRDHRARDPPRQQHRSGHDARVERVTADERGHQQRVPERARDA